MAHQKLAQLFDAYWNETLRMSPTSATFVGVHKYNHKLADLSVKHANKSYRIARKYELALVKINDSELDEQELISKRMMLESIGLSRQFRQYPTHCLAIDQMMGVHLGFLNIARIHPFNTVKDFQDYASRLAAFSKQIRQVLGHLKQGVLKGWTLSRVTVDLLIPQIRSLIVTPENSQYYKVIEAKFDVLPKGVRANIKRRVLSEIGGRVNRELRRLSNYLENEYSGKTRKLIGLCGLPQGQKLYQLYLQNHTALNYSADQIHKIGVEEVDRIHQEMEEIKHQMNFKGSLHDFFEYMRDAKEHHYETREEILEHHKSLLAEMEKKVPEFFNVIPKNPYDVLPMPEYQEKEAPDAYYMPGDSKNKRPGTYYVNTYEPHTRGKFNAEALAFHEAIPGHHFQISIAQELEGLPEFRKRAQETAYVEGWALYTEKLSEEMGFYNNPAAVFGRLCFEVWRAVRLVVDTGIHSKGWSREQAVEYMKKNTALSEANINVEVDRYIVMPGQAVSYKMGEIFIMNLRKKYEEKLGNKFDLKKFHDVLLKNGAIPLDILAQVMESQM